MNILTIIFVFLIFGSSHSFASEEKNLKKLNAQIKNLTSSIQQDKLNRNHYTDEIKLTDKKITTLTSELKGVRQQIKSLSKELNTISSKGLKNQNDKKNEIKNILKSIHTLYTQFNYEDNKNQVKHDTVHAKHLIKTQLKHLDQLEIIQNSYNKSKASYLSKRQELLDLKSNKDVKKYQLKLQKNKKNILIRKINSQLIKKNKNLNTLIVNQKRLKKLIKQKSIFNTHRYHNITKPQHNLSWPTSGKVVHKFGDHIGKSEFKYEALYLKTNRKDIHSISEGIVIYSGQLEGYGQIIIIDHGHGMMSLYGHCDKLIYHRGDHITKGKIIAYHSRTSWLLLYFASDRDARRILVKYVLCEQCAYAYNFNHHGSAKTTGCITCVCIYAYACILTSWQTSTEYLQAN